MPQQIINVYDRPTYQTEKVKGWDVVRMLKASALSSDQNGGQFVVSEGDYIIRNFTQNYGTNYKGTNLIDLSKLENFNSIRLRMNGLVPDGTGGWFNFRLGLYDTSYNVASEIDSNYGYKLDLPNYSTSYDWYMDIELTFYVDDNGYYNFVVNGNYSASLNDNPSKRSNVNLAPFQGILSIPPTNQPHFIDLTPNYGGSGQPYIIKSVSMDFVE